MTAYKPTIYRWPLDDSANRFQSAVFKQKWESDDFTVKGIPDAKFRVWFCPKGDREEYKDACQTYLHVQEFGGRPCIRLKYEFWFKCEKKDQLIGERGTERTFAPTSNSWGYANASQAELAELATNGPLILFCKIVPLDSVGSIKRAVEVAPLDVLAKIAANFGSDQFADVEVRVQQKVFKVNKMIICSGSPAFYRMFSHDTKVKKSGVITIKKEKADMIELLLRYFYSGKVEGLPEVADRLLPVADCYEVLELVELCLESLVANASVETILCDLKLAFTHDHTGDYQRQLLEFAKGNFNLVRQQPDWTDDFIRENPEIVKKFMEVAFP